MSKYDKMTQNEKIKTILEHFGITNQIDKTIEELNELKECLSYIEIERNIYDMKPEHIEHLVSELADVYIMCEQLMEHYKLEHELDITIDYKLNRTLERIETGYYKNNKLNKEEK